ncbi:hypothetical protein ACL1FY_10820, partial [Corynebacterium striatum]
ATPADRGAANINYERKPLAVPGTWNPGTNYADSRYQLPQIDTPAARSQRIIPKNDPAGCKVRAMESTSRPKRAYLSFIATALAFFVVPGIVGAALSGSTATVTMLVLLPMMALALGMLDGRLFRYTLSFPLIAAFMFWLSTKVYYNTGTWIYAVEVVLLAWLGSWLTGRKA